eukprot:m.188295 g.188295  ORF g.188295 m.188295 type:complete len:60 (-) comp18524_c0_seq4:320-499(-)
MGDVSQTLFYVNAFAGLAEIKKLGGNDILVGLFDKLSKLYKDIDAQDKSGSGSDAASKK